MAYGKPFQQLSIKDSIQEAKENKIINKGLKIKYYLKNNLQINFKIIPFNKIYNELKKYIESEELHFDYRQRPKLYCFDKYGDLELYDFILYINNCKRNSDFNKNMVFYLNEEGVKLYENIISKYTKTNYEFEITPFRKID